MGEYIRARHFWRSLSQLPLDTFASALDAGCGRGRLALEFARRYPNLAVHGADIDASVLPVSSMNCTFQQADLTRPSDLESEYDLVYCIDVLEHIPGNREAIRNLAGQLKPGGYIYIHLPTSHAPGHFLPSRLFKEFDAWACQEHRGMEFTSDELVGALRSAALDIVDCRNTFELFGQLAWELDWVTNRRLWLRIVLAPLLLSLAAVSVRRSPPRGGGVMVLARRAADEDNIRNT
jgi:2-polyprenyl-3-methyl-5-hydroxy-6-metoxy-1,4-benzoquinol methylase